ncbi:MAG: DNA-binding protein [Oscillospiraceae bacterium]|nr:DNA-binding protein [Oscillospiraceae bacterium]
MKNQAFRMTMLYDFYGEILTERQREFYDLYYNEDLSLSEIAENYGISRQGVRDVIVRAEAVMTEIEDKTGIVKRFMGLRDKLDAIESAAVELRELNYRRYENPDLDRLANVIAENAAALKE